MEQKTSKSKATGANSQTEMEMKPTQAAPVKARAGKQASEPAVMPLFFKEPKALDKNRHKDAGIRVQSGYKFAFHTNSIPLTAIEFIEAGKHFPIVFTPGAEALPVAMVGLEQHNYFVEPSGSWKAGSYIPAYVRQYPFVFFEDKAAGKCFLCIDEAAEAFAERKGKGCKPLFEGEEPAEITNSALAFCSATFQQQQITQNFCADLKKYDLLVPQQSDATLASGKKMKLSGFMVIDEARFNALPAEVFLEFRQKGWLVFIYLALASFSNWKTLLAHAPAAGNTAAA